MDDRQVVSIDDRWLWGHNVLWYSSSLTCSASHGLCLHTNLHCHKLSSKRGFKSWLLLGVPTGQCFLQKHKETWIWLPGHFVNSTIDVYIQAKWLLHPIIKFCPVMLLDLWVIIVGIARAEYHPCVCTSIQGCLSRAFIQVHGNAIAVSPPGVGAICHRTM